MSLCCLTICFSSFVLAKTDQNKTTSTLKNSVTAKKTMAAAAQRGGDFKIQDGWIDIALIKASAYIVYDATTDQILYEKNSKEKLANASTTKILNALTAVDTADFDPQNKLLVSAAATKFSSEEAVRLGVLPGEVITTDDAMHAMLMMSANDCARVIADNYGGGFGFTGTAARYKDKKLYKDVEVTSETVNQQSVSSQEKFIAKMNAKAKKLGAKNTHFSDPCGFDSDDHYTTAYDLAILGKALLQNPYLADIVKSDVALARPTNMHPFRGWGIIRTTNGLVYPGAKLLESRYFAEYNGIKTGTTDTAGYCLVGSGITLAKHQIIGVILNDQTTWQQANCEIPVYAVMRSLLEYGAFLSGAPPQSDFAQTQNSGKTTVKPSLTSKTEISSPTKITLGSYVTQCSDKNRVKSANCVRSDCKNIGVASKSAFSDKRQILISVSSFCIGALLMLIVVNIYFSHKRKREKKRENL